MMIAVTKLELQFLEETLETVLEEFEGFEECADPSDYTLTTGAVELTKEALVMIKRLAQNEEVELSADASTDS